MHSSVWCVNRYSVTSINLKNPSRSLLFKFQPLDLHSCPKPIVFIIHSFLSAKITRLGLVAWTQERPAFWEEGCYVPRKRAIRCRVPSDVACHSQLSIPRVLSNCPRLPLPVSPTARGWPGRKHHREHQKKTQWVNRRGRLEIHSIAFDNQGLEQ